MSSRGVSRFSFAALAALLSLTAAQPVLASLLPSIGFETNENYQQVSATPPVNPTNYSLEISVTFTNPGDYSGASVTYPGPGSMVLPATKSTQFAFFQSYATLGALHAAFPLGAYNFTIDAGNQQPTVIAQVAYSADLFETSGVPALTPVTFNGLNGMNPSAAFNITYNSFTPNANSNLPITYFEVNDLSNNNAAVLFLSNPPSSTGFTLPANALLPNHNYSWELVFDDNLRSQNASLNLSQIESDVITNGTFTTGAATPEPATFGLIGVGVAGLAVLRRGRRATIIGGQNWGSIGTVCSVWNRSSIERPQRVQ